MAHLVWERFGDVRNYVEPFCGSLAVLLGRPTEPKIETVNDLDCVAPDTRILKSDLMWTRAGDVVAGDHLLGFDESNGEARTGLRVPKRYRRFAGGEVLGVRRLRKPCYRLTFDDGTSVVASADHLWLGGSHKTGGRGWRWVKTANMVCNRTTQRSWVLKVTDVVQREESFNAGWLGGMLDGEGCIKAGPGLMLSLTQNEGPTLDRVEDLLTECGIKWARRKCRRSIRRVEIKGGMVAQLSVLMRFRPERLIQKLIERLPHVSLYGREHRAVGLVAKEYLGEQEVVAIQTDCHTFIAEGLASHNCWIANFWRAAAADPEQVAHYADWPVNEADLHARHLWLVKQTEFRERMKTDPDFFDPKIAGWWVWGISQWIGSGWCATRYESRGKGLRIDGTPQQKIPAVGKLIMPGRTNAGRYPRGIHTKNRQEPPGDPWLKRPNIADAGRSINVSDKRPFLTNHGGGMGVHSNTAYRDPGNQKRPRLGRGDRGVSRQLPDLSDEAGMRMRQGRLYDWFQALADRLRRVRVCCGDWKRILGPAPTTCIGTTGVFLDPPYSVDDRADVYGEESRDVAHDVREWAIANGDNPDLLIALCGYDGEHTMPDSWECLAWKANGGFANQKRKGTQGQANAGRERIWFSPACLPLQGKLYFNEP